MWYTTFRIKGREGKSRKDEMEEGAGTDEDQGGPNNRGAFGGSGFAADAWHSRASR